MTNKDKLRHYTRPMPGRVWIDGPSAFGIGSALLLWAGVAMSTAPVAIQISILLGFVFPALLAFVWSRDRLGLRLGEFRRELSLLAAAACLLSAPLQKILNEISDIMENRGRKKEKQASDRSTAAEKIELIQVNKFLRTPLLPARRPGARVTAAS